jgi:PIN domain nuclease of toxin-antitoxin system
MAEAVFDSSAVLAIIRDEAGSEITQARLAAGVISAVNYAEIITRLIDFGSTPQEAAEVARELDLEVRPLDLTAAAATGMLRAATRQRGLSLGDRACLALAAQAGLPVLTADRAWAELDLGVEVVLIR